MARIKPVLFLSLALIMDPIAALASGSIDPFNPAWMPPNHVAQPQANQPQGSQPQAKPAQPAATKPNPAVPAAGPRTTTNQPAQPSTARGGTMPRPEGPGDDMQTGPNVGTGTPNGTPPDSTPPEKPRPKDPVPPDESEDNENPPAPPQPSRGGTMPHPEGPGEDMETGSNVGTGAPNGTSVNQPQQPSTHQPAKPQRPGASGRELTASEIRIAIDGFNWDYHGEGTVRLRGLMYRGCIDRFRFDSRTNSSTGLNTIVIIDRGGGLDCVQKQLKLRIPCDPKVNCVVLQKEEFALLDVPGDGGIVLGSANLQNNASTTRPEPGLHRRRSDRHQQPEDFVATLRHQVTTCRRSDEQLEVAETALERLAKFITADEYDKYAIQLDEAKLKVLAQKVRAVRLSRDESEDLNDEERNEALIEKLEDLADELRSFLDTHEGEKISSKGADLFREIALKQVKLSGYSVGGYDRAEEKLNEALDLPDLRSSKIARLKADLEAIKIGRTAAQMDRDASILALTLPPNTDPRLISQVMSRNPFYQNLVRDMYINASRACTPSMRPGWNRTTFNLEACANRQRALSQTRNLVTNSTNVVIQQQKVIQDAFKTTQGMTNGFPGNTNYFNPLNMGGGLSATYGSGGVSPWSMSRQGF